QGVWLLSRFRDPFVTIRGLSLFGDHTSYILVLVAPLYWVWADPRRLLLLLQGVGPATPAVGLSPPAATGSGRGACTAPLLASPSPPPTWPTRQCSGPRSGASTPRPWRLASSAWPPWPRIDNAGDRWPPGWHWPCCARRTSGWWWPGSGPCCGPLAILRSAAAPWQPAWAGSY